MRKIGSKYQFKVDTSLSYFGDILSLVFSDLE